MHLNRRLPILTTHPGLQRHGRFPPPTPTSKPPASSSVRDAAGGSEALPPHAMEFLKSASGEDWRVDRGLGRGLDRYWLVLITAEHRPWVILNTQKGRLILKL